MQLTADVIELISIKLETANWKEMFTLSQQNIA